MNVAVKLHVYVLLQTFRHL